MAFEFDVESVRVLGLKLGPKHSVQLELPQGKGIYYDKLTEFVNANHGLLESRIIELAPKCRVIIPQNDDWIEIQAFRECELSKGTGKSWQTVMEGPSAEIFPFCQDIYDGDQVARDAVTCATDGEVRDYYRGDCDQCQRMDRPFHECFVLDGEFGGACANCILRGWQASCTARELEEEYKPPSESRANIGRKRKRNQDGQEWKRKRQS